MTLIPCADNCIYQQDGFCRMETPSIVTNIETNTAKNGCIHKIEPNKLNNTANLNIEQRP